MTRANWIQDYMTPVPHAVDAAQSVFDALSRMHALGVGHLPVFDTNQLVGMVRERDLDLCCDTPGFDAEATPVADVMDVRVCSVPPEAPLASVVRSMAKQHADCCAVLDGERLVGILTSTDALRILADVLGSNSAPAETRPSEVHARILNEHSVLRRLFEDVEQLATAVERDDPDAEASLRERCRALQFTVERHIELENAILVPVLQTIDGFGPVRAARMLEEHAAQARTLVDFGADTELLTAEALAAAAAALIHTLRVDMEHEEQTLVHTDLLHDDIVQIAGTG